MSAEKIIIIFMSVILFVVLGVLGYLLLRPPTALGAVTSLIERLDAKDAAEYKEKQDSLKEEEKASEDVLRVERQRRVRAESNLRKVKVESSKKIDSLTEQLITSQEKSKESAVRLSEEIGPNDDLDNLLAANNESLETCKMQVVELKGLADAEARARKSVQKENVTLTRQLGIVRDQNKLANKRISQLTGWRFRFSLQAGAGKCWFTENDWCAYTGAGLSFGK